LNISLAHIEQGRIREAREALDEVFTLRQRIPARLTGAAEFNLGVCEESAGNLRESGIHYQASLDIRNQVGQDALAIDSLAGLTRIALATGEQDLARQYLAEVDRRIGQHGLEGIEHFGRLFLTRYRGHGAIGNPSQAASVLNQALDILRQRATLLIDPADRHDFLNNVPTHRELIEHGKATGSIAPGDPLLSYAETPAGS
jgi:tetratricopeptide (TPR) repeat protein